MKTTTALQKTTPIVLVFVQTIKRCYWCGQALRQCGTCKGSGLFRNEKCKPCNGNGCLCPTHEGDWDL